jgi:hypothetical protein
VSLRLVDARVPLKFTHQVNEDCHNNQIKKLEMGEKRTSIDQAEARSFSSNVQIRR